jgi:hypothetical protein
MKIRLIFGLLFSVFASLTVLAQHKVSKNEILNEYRINRRKPDLDSIFRWEIHSTVRTVLDSLIKTNVDTLLVCSFSFPGYGNLGKTDSCSTLYPTNSYFFWKKGGKYSYKGIDGTCQSQIKQNDGKVIKFVLDNYGMLKDEFFIGTVLGAERNGKQIRIKEFFINHEPKYSILMIIRDQFNYLEFTENALTNKASLFLDYNKGLNSYKLFELIKTQLGTIE